MGIHRHKPTIEKQARGARSSRRSTRPAHATTAVAAVAVAAVAAAAVAVAAVAVAAAAVGVGTGAITQSRRF